MSEIKVWRPCCNHRLSLAQQFTVRTRESDGLALRYDKPGLKVALAANERRLSGRLLGKLRVLSPLVKALGLSLVCGFK